MKKKTVKINTGIVLTEIRNTLFEIRELLKEKKETNKVSAIDSDYLTLTFPNKTAKEMVEECGNKLGEGKLLYDTRWYEKEDFYTKEKCDVGTFKVSKDIIGFGKNWDECKKLVEEKGGKMLSFPQVIYFAQEYYKQTGKYPWSGNYSWTSSRSLDRSVVYLGYFASYGADVDGGWPGDSDSRLGSAFSLQLKP